MRQYSMIDLLGMNVACEGWMMLSKTSWSPEARILVMTLYATLHSAIVRNISTLFGAADFLIKAIKVWFTAWVNFPSSKNCWAAYIRYFSICCPKCFAEERSNTFRPKALISLHLKDSFVTFLSRLGRQIGCDVLKIHVCLLCVYYE